MTIDHRLGVRMTRRLRRGVTGAALVALLALAATACGSSGSSVSSRPESKQSPASRPSDVPGMQTVEYRGIAFDVPADWPVHDLAQDPTTCVRFDVHAVYLGSPGADMRCPAGLVGRTDALLVQPAESDGARVAVASATGLGGQQINDLSVQVADDTDSSGDVVATTGPVTATISTGATGATAQRILGSFRSAGSAGSAGSVGSAGS
jgi:hypothetical protein